MSKRISESKAKEVSKFMTKGINEKRKKLEKELGDVISEALLRQVPSDVLALYKIKPDWFKKASSFYYKRIGNPNNGVYIVPKPIPVASNDSVVLLKSIYQDTEICVEAEKIFDKIILEKERYDKMRGKIECVLSKVNTYAKIKNEFPEAYEALMILDGSVYEGDKIEGLCDSIENLRAEIGGIK